MNQLFEISTVRCSMLAWYVDQLFEISTIRCSMLSKTSHVVLDEIHERDTLSDFLMIIMRDLLQRRRGIKLILMSATLNAEEFAAYFSKFHAFMLFICCKPVSEWK